MRRSADNGQKRARKEIESTESLNEGTSLPSAKRKRSEHYQLDPSDDELASMEELENALQEERPDKKYIKKAMKNTYRASGCLKSVHLYLKYFKNFQFFKPQNK